MDKASILRTLRELNNFYKWIDPDFKALSDNLNSFRELKEESEEIPYPPFLPPYPPNQDNATSLIEHIINNDDMASFKALNEIYSNIGAIKKYRNDLMAYLIICNAEGLKEGEERVFINFLTSLIRDLGLLDDWLRSREPEEEKCSFDSFILIAKKERLIKKLHLLIDNSTGRKSVLPIKVALGMKLMDKPTYKDFIAEFGKKISESEYSKAFNDPKFSDEEIRNMELKLSGFKH